MKPADQETAISLLESASAALWRAGGNNSLAREIDRFLDAISPDSSVRIEQRLKEPKP